MNNTGNLTLTDNIISISYLDPWNMPNAGPCLVCESIQRAEMINGIMADFAIALIITGLLIWAYSLITNMSKG